MNARLWKIGDPSGASDQLLDNYKEPGKLGDIVWDADAGRSADGSTRWPMFQPSEADPESGYRLHPYTIRFAIAGTPAPAYLLRLHMLTIAPRLGYLDVGINGTYGEVQLRVAPSASGDIALHSGLHTTIYADGVADVVVPGELLRKGKNELVLVARDAGETIRVERIEAVKRLDRMANAAGVLYRAVEWFEAEATLPPVARAEAVSTVVYKRDDAGTLRNACKLYLELGASVSSARLTLTLEGEDGLAQDVPVSIDSMPFGHLAFPFDIPDGEGDVRYRLNGTVEGVLVDVAGTFRRRRKWTVYVTPHAHTDIGYTHRQWEVAERLCRNLDTAVEWIESEAGAASPSFAYHLDSGWVLETYLQTRSPDFESFKL